MCGGSAAGAGRVLFDAHGRGQVGGVPAARLVLARPVCGVLATHIAHTGPGTRGGAERRQGEGGLAS